MSRHILAIDQGTTGTTAAIFNSIGEVVAKVNEEFPQHYPKPGWVEHDPEEIWNSVSVAVTKVLAESGVQGQDIAGIGITNQRETVILWERASGRPVHKALVWQDRRTADFCESLKKKGHARILKEKTGLIIDPYFSASKMRWLLDHVSGAKEKARKGSLAVGTIESFLLWKLTKGTHHATDVSNASRTQLMNIKTGAWDPALLKIFGIPHEILPEIKPNSAVFGETRGLDFLPDGIPITGMVGDQQAALFGQACFKIGDAKCTYGTGSFLLLNSGTKAPEGKSGVLTTVAWKLASDKNFTYALEGSAFISGAAVQWLRDGLGFFQQSSKVELLAKSVPDSGGVEFVPALTGLGAPYWDPQARGMICGITRGTTRAHIARATLEGIALQNLDLLNAMQKDLGNPIRRLKVDGGAAVDDTLMQIQADYLGTELIRPKNIETTAAGAAFMAGLGIGLWKDLKEIEKIWKQDRVFKSIVSKSQRAERLKRWHLAIKRVRLR